MTLEAFHNSLSVETLCRQ